MAAVTAETDNEAAIPHPLPEPLVDLIARRFRVLGEPTRIRLLDLLREHDATVTELHEALGASQQNVSKHLGVLHQAGVVSRRKEGPSVRYALVDWTGWWLVEQISRSLADHLDASIAQAGIASPTAVDRLLR